MPLFLRLTALVTILCLATIIPTIGGAPSLGAFEIIEHIEDLPPPHITHVKQLAPNPFHFIEDWFAPALLSCQYHPEQDPRPPSLS